MLRRLFTLLLISMLPILAMGQNGTVYPIDLSVMMTPPYGTCLKEYVGSDRIVVQALLKDFSKKSEQFVVQLKVTDNRNRVVLLTNFGGYDFPAGKTFTYPMGPNADQGDKNNVLHQLFENAKIQPKNECFEEGAYTFEFQAFQAASYPSRKIALSMPFRYPVFLQGNTVQPLQIYPYENEVICSHAFEYTNENGIKRNATQLGGIAYQWQSANPTGMRVGYLLQVVDLGLIGDKKWSDIKSEAGGIFGRVDKESYRVNELTYAPFYNHAFSAGNYEENHAYAWRVLALVGKDLELGKNASVNDNNAPVRVFYFCGAPGIEKDDYEVIKDDREFDKNLHKVKMDTVKSTDLNALALWRDSSVKDAYCGVNVEIRKKGQEKWTPYFVEQTNKYDESIDPTDNSYTFTNLSYNTRYEVRAQYVKCENCAQRPTGCVYAPYSDILEFVIAQPIDSATCGQNLPKLADCGDGVKAPRILAGDTIIANGTKVVVDSVSYPNASDSSIISGKGHICMPIVKNIQLKMEFNEITINCAKELVKGKVVSVWDDKTCAMIDIDELGGQNSTGGTDNTASDATVEEYDPSTANDKPAGTLMVDKDGTVKFKTKDGKIEDIGKSITLSAQEYQSKDFLSDNAHYIEFYNEDKNNAFDNNAQGYYDKISKYEYFDSPLNKVVLPWLANNPGKLKKIKAREVKKKETIASFESVMFVIPSGDSYIKLDAKQDKDGNYDLQIPGWADVDYSTPIYAIARNSAESSYFDAGKMMQANYAERTHKLIIVPTKEEYSADVAKIQEQLNAIYGRVGVTYTVEEDRSFVNDEYVNVMLDDGLDVDSDEESRWTVETSEMTVLREIYEETHPNMDKKAAYLFLVNKAESPYESVDGDMPRNQSVGYIFMRGGNKFDDGRLIAHELGHGVYKFQHTFDYKIPEKSTDNLMDYNGGDFLAHYQWRVMQDSVMFVWKALQDNEDGMWTTDGHYYLFTYIGMLMGMSYEEAEMYGRWSEEPDTQVGDDGSMHENITWLIPELQQRNHALTGGYHGVELAATVYAIHFLNNFKYINEGARTGYIEPDFMNGLKLFLLHRFGDCYAHTKMKYDNSSEGKFQYDDVELTDYIAAFDKYIDSHFTFTNTPQRWRYDPQTRVTDCDKNFVIYKILSCIFSGKDDSWLRTNFSGVLFTYDQICKDLLALLPKAKQNDFKTYGDIVICETNNAVIDGLSEIALAFRFPVLYLLMKVSGVEGLTLGHMLSGSKVDDILVREQLFYYYAKKVAELYVLLGKGDPSSIPQVQMEIQNFIHIGKLVGERYKKEEFYDTDEEYSREDVINAKFDVFYSFVIHMMRYKGNKNYSRIKIPIKYLTNERRTSKVWLPIAYSQFTYKNENESDGIYRDRESVRKSIGYFKAIFEVMKNLEKDDPWNLPAKYNISDIRVLPRVSRKYVLIDIKYNK